MVLYEKGKMLFGGIVKDTVDTVKSTVVKGTDEFVDTIANSSVDGVANALPQPFGEMVKEPAKSFINENFREPMKKSCKRIYRNIRRSCKYRIGRILWILWIQSRYGRIQRP